MRWLLFLDSAATTCSSTLVLVDKEHKAATLHVTYEWELLVRTAPLRRCGKKATRGLVNSEPPGLRRYWPGSRGSRPQIDPQTPAQFLAFLDPRKQVPEGAKSCNNSSADLEMSQRTPNPAHQSLPLRQAR